MREFNSTGLCVPRKHYMVDISDRVAQMRAMVERGDYFCVNRARQYGKTTTLVALEDALAHDYAVVGLDFQALSHADFATEGHFVDAFAREVLREADYGILELPDEASEALAGLRDADANGLRLPDLFSALALWNRRSPRPVVLIIDEVDSATNNQVFLDFLAQLRLGYLEHERRPSVPAFQSVILAGVTDVKHLKARIRPDGESKVNSPWNIAADFDVDMSFSVADVAGMLAQYEADHHTGMDAAAVAEELVAWTAGYPFLVSRLCQLVDKHGLAWDRAGVDAAVRLLLVERNTLFDSLMGKLEDYPELKKSLRGLLMEGREVAYNPDQEEISQLSMYGFVKNCGGRLAVANRVFETRLYNLFLSDEELRGGRASEVGDAASLDRSLFTEGGRLNMRAVLEGFRRTYTEVYGPLEEGGRFAEKDGRELFLMYLKPIINGTGNYYVEAQTRDQTRTDVVVDYLGERFVVELKVWRGPRYNKQGERQVAGYLERFGLDVGYMLSFNFNKRKEPGMRRVALGNKVLWEETV
ncbi:MAG: AAA-like domain-containing protein [Atopobiaceae bacterium]|nr:AAA-like domain-containing protein [Atopobiaceae bacterium]